MAENKRTTEETLLSVLSGNQVIRIVDLDETDPALQNKKTTPAAIAAAGDVVTTIDGTTAGFVLLQQSVDGSGAKRVMAVFVGYENDTVTAQTWDFPTAFDHTPIFWPNSDPECSADIDTLTLPASMTGALDAVVEIKGI